MIDLLIETELFGINLIDLEDLGELIMRFAFTMSVLYVIVRKIYYPRSLRRDYLFTYFLISLIVFFLSILLNSVKLQLGFALGLFAVFGIIRYRTDPIPIKEMTYLFVVIGIAVINALSNKKVSYAELFFANFAVLIIVWVLESVWFLKHETKKVIQYEKIELIRPAQRAELIADLEERTGLTINRVQIDKIDFLKDTARIIIFYYLKQEEPETNS